MSVADANGNGRRILIFDTTLRDGEQSPGATMTESEKLDVADALVALGVDIIEAGFPAASPGDFEAVRLISERVKGATVAGLSRANRNDIERAAHAVKGAEQARIHTFIATSDIHLEHKLRMTREQVLERIGEMVAFAKSFTSDVEFSAEDATRSDWAFLVEVFAKAIAAGASAKRRAGSTEKRASAPAWPVPTSTANRPADEAHCTSEVVSPMSQVRVRSRLRSAAACSTRPVAGLRQPHGPLSAATSPGKPRSGWCGQT